METSMLNRKTVGSIPGNANKKYNIKMSSEMKGFEI
jgi:hypothetical protein